MGGGKFNGFHYFDRQKYSLNRDYNNCIMCMLESCGLSGGGKDCFMVVGSGRGTKKLCIFFITSQVIFAFNNAGWETQQLF